MNYENQVGILSNLYAYEPMRSDGPAENFLGFIGGALGNAIGGFLAADAGHLPATVANDAARTAGAGFGKFAGETIGQYIDSADVVSGNVSTFIKELNDWRSWSGVMSNWGGGG